MSMLSLRVLKKIKYTSRRRHGVDVVNGFTPRIVCLDVNGTMTLLEGGCRSMIVNVELYLGGQE
jgi:hypothetical protein